MGGILNIRWAHNGIVSTGPYCTAQGVIQQFGELGVGLITLVRIFSLCPCVKDQLIHILPDSRRPHVRSSNVGLGSKSRGFALGLVLVAFSFCALSVGMGPGIHIHYEIPTPVRCFNLFNFELYPHN
jgi:hypothetical protein